MPLINGKKPPVPGLLLLESSGAAKFALAVPRKKEEFTPEWIAEWLSASARPAATRGRGIPASRLLCPPPLPRRPVLPQAHDVDVKYEEAPPPEEPEPGHGGDGEYPYGDD